MFNDKVKQRYIVAAYRAGDHVVYPGQGPAEILRVEDKLGQPMATLRVAATNTSLSVPVQQLESKVRAVMKPAEAVQVLQHLKEPMPPSKERWNRRLRAMGDLVAHGSARDLADVLREVRGHEQPSFAEKKLRERALSMLAAEMGLALDIPDAEARQRIEQAL